MLVDLSADARLVVVQHRDVNWLGRLFVGSTVNGVAAHGECPVVSVPEGWEAAEEPGTVVVGVHEGGAPQEAVAAALDWAAGRGAPVRVVHAWRLDSAYDDIVTARVSAEWHGEQVRAVESAVSNLTRSHPEVPVSVEVRHEWPTQALVEESESASMVVVGRHAGIWGGAPTRRGSVARTVLREAKSPVMVVPLGVSRARAQDWGLDADELSPQT